MSQPERLPAGGRIDRSSALPFSFDGRALEGHPGDTVASALLANGVHFVARSFKYHRPRGIVGAGVEEPNALLTVDGGTGRLDPNISATTLPLAAGMRLASQHCWPSLNFDAGAIGDWLSPVLPAGFYYKTFLWPRKAWHALYEPLIRRSAGLGPAPTHADPDRYVQRHAHCDVLVIGTGPSGLAAALAASETGARVIVCDEQAEEGGSILSLPHERIDDRSAWQWREHARETLRGRAAVRLLPRTTAFSYGAENYLGLVEHLAVNSQNSSQLRQRLWLVRARQVILATGALERPLVFRDNDRPGIMLASAARTYLNRYGVRPGRRAVLVASHDSGYEAAFDLHAQGTHVRAIVDVRASIRDELRAHAKANGIEVLENHAPCGSDGRRRVESLHVAARRPDGTLDRARQLPCDLILMAGGWTPSVHLHSQARGALIWDDNLECFLPGQASQAVSSVGAARGTMGLAECLEEGAAAGNAAAIAVGRTGGSRPVPSGHKSQRAEGGRLLDNVVPATDAKRAFVDFQNDVTVGDIELAVREGFRSIEHVKRYTTLGMATDQGRTSNLHGLAIAARQLGVPIPAVGLTTFRAPFTPVAFGALAGSHHGALFDPVRSTPMHEWAEQQSAVFEDVGLWKRARYFPRAGEDMHAAVMRECRATRASVGLFDASTLGKIEVVGPDAGEFMNRMYTNAWSKLEVGRCRYGLMLREDGFIFDDGVVGRIAADRFHVTTTTGGAPRVLNFMEDYLQTEFTDLKVWLTSTTEQWAVIALNGPKARRVIETLVEGIDIRAESFPHMSVRLGRICGVPTRLFRVSFTGELGFEINIPASAGPQVLKEVYDAGAAYGIAPYGTEAMHVLRAEKGYIIVGQETDGTVTPGDLGMDWAVGKNKRDFVGKRSLSRSGLAAEDRLQLVGLLSEDRKTVLPEGGQLVATASQPPMASLGHVTSAYFSSALEQPIALAMLRAGRKRVGERLFVPLASGNVAVQVTAPVFVDPEGRRLLG